MKKTKAPILVTGAPRSGTTFLGKMLSLHPSVAYIDEPFNKETGLEGIDRHYAFITKDDPELEAKYAALVHDLLAGKSNFRSSTLRPQTSSALRKAARQLLVSRENIEYKLNAKNPLKTRQLLKDPMACLSTEYLHREMGMHAVVIMRHPASTIASYKRLGWRFGLHDFTSQKELMQQHLAPVFAQVDASKLSPIQEWAYFWLGIHTVLDEFLRKNSTMLLVRHEDLSLKPLHYLKWLYEKLELPFTEKIKQQIIDHTNADNPADPTNNAAHVLKRNSAENIHRWKQMLTTEEIAEIKRITAPVADKYYTADEW